MTKTKTKAPKRKQAQQPKKRQPVDLRAQQYLKLLSDPCNAVVPHGAVYSGESGIVSRFASELTVGTGAGETCGFLAFHPNDNTVCVFTQALASTTAVVNAGNFTYTNSPGLAFVTNNCAKIRSLAACISAMPNTSALNAVGDIAVGNITLSSLYATISVNDVFALLTARGPIVRKNYEVKMVPGEFDSKYSKAFVGANPSTTGTDDSDTTTVIIAWRGLPAATGFNARLTSVVEWTPIKGVGMTVSSATVSGINTTALVSAASSRQPSWWHNVASELVQDLSQTARYVGRQALSAGAAYLTGGMSRMIM